MIAYFDTSMLVKLLVDDEAYRAEVGRIWIEAEYVGAQKSATPKRARL